MHVYLGTCYLHWVSVIKKVIDSLILRNDALAKQWCTCKATEEASFTDGSLKAGKTACSGVRGSQ